MKIYRKLFLVVLALASLAVSSFAASDEEKKSALLYEVTGPGIEKPSYLYGTIHLVCTDQMLPIKTLSKYMSKTERLFLELDFDDPGQIQKLLSVASKPGKEDLSEHLTEEQVAKVDKLTRDVLGKPFDELKFSNPVLLMTELSTSKAAIGCEAQGSYDLSLLGIALANKFPIEGLETVDRQIEALAKTPTKKYANQLYEMAKDPEKSFSLMRKLMATYQTQDSDALYSLMSENPDSDPNFKTSVLDERNVEWIPIIEKAVKERSSFIAFGAAHLGGKKGVVNLLREKGFKLKPIFVE